MKQPPTAESGAVRRSQVLDDWPARGFVPGGPAMTGGRAVGPAQGQLEHAGSTSRGPQTCRAFMLEQGWWLGWAPSRASAGVCASICERWRAAVCLLGVVDETWAAEMAIMA